MTLCKLAAFCLGQCNNSQSMRSQPEGAVSICCGGLVIVLDTFKGTLHTPLTCSADSILPARHGTSVNGHCTFRMLSMLHVEGYAVLLQGIRHTPTLPQWLPQLLAAPASLQW